MTDVLLPNTTLSRKNLLERDPSLLAAFSANNTHALGGDLQPNTPYCVSPEPDPAARAINQAFHSLTPSQRDQLGCCAERFGVGTNTLAAFYERQLAGVDLQASTGTGASLAGMGATVLAARSGSFGGALESYQQALRSLHEANRAGRVDPVTRAELRRGVHQAFDTLNTHYRRELEHLAPDAHMGRNRGSALTSAARGITLAERSRARGLHLADIHEASRLANFSRAVRHLGRGILVLDVGMRVNTVYRVRATHGEWVRELAVQTGGLGGASLAAYSVGRGSAALMARIALTATPWGWVVLIGSAVVIGAVVAYQADQMMQRETGSLWDKVFN